MSSNMINYIVCCWFGPRGSKKYSKLIQDDNFYFVNKHLEFLDTYSKGDIGKATFVINARVDEDIDTIKKFFNGIKLSSNIKVDYFLRDNKDSNGLVRGSYGAWNDAIIKDVTANTDIEKFLMFEDDYILVNEDCVYPYIERCTKESPLVCSYVMKPNQWCIEHLSHATPVCVDKMIAKEIYDEHKEVLYFEQPNPSLSDYLNLCNVQQFCQKYFTDKGYKLVDVLDEYSTGYLYCNQPGFAEELLVVFGDPQNETLVIPIGYMDYEYEDPYELMPSIHTR